MEIVGNLLRSVAISRKSVFVCSFSTQMLLRGEYWQCVKSLRTREEEAGNNQELRVNIPRSPAQWGALDVSVSDVDQRVR